jgi:hypothetical protein
MDLRDGDGERGRGHRRGRRRGRRVGPKASRGRERGGRGRRLGRRGNRFQRAGPGLRRDSHAAHGRPRHGLGPRWYGRRGWGRTRRIVSRGASHVGRRLERRARRGRHRRGRGRIGEGRGVGRRQADVQRGESGPGRGEFARRGRELRFRRRDFRRGRSPGRCRGRLRDTAPRDHDRRRRRRFELTLNSSARGLVGSIPRPAGFRHRWRGRAGRLDHIVEPEGVSGPVDHARSLRGRGAGCSGLADEGCRLDDLLPGPLEEAPARAAELVRLEVLIAALRADDHAAFPRCRPGCRGPSLAASESYRTGTPAPGDATRAVTPSRPRSGAARAQASPTRSGPPGAASTQSPGR